MIKLRQLGTFALALALLSGALAWPSDSARAQTNLLVNGSLERPYYGQGGPTRTAPSGWNLWVGAGAPEAFPHTDRVQVIDGEVSWNVKQGDGVFTAAGYQRVTGLSAGTRLRASASAWVYTCNDRVNSCIIPDPPYRRSDPSAGSSVKVGIDPTGGTDPLSTTVVWSGGVAPYDQWAVPSVVADAQGDAVTVFLYMTQAQGLAMNNVYWDNAQLVRTDEAVTPGGAPGGAAAPPPPVVQEAPFVMAQNVRPDGSIVHIIQEGDTLSSIAYAYSQYDVTRESIAELNEGIRPNTALLRPGTELIILAPGSVDPLTGRPDSGAAGGTPVRTIIGALGQGSGGSAATPVPTITPRGAGSRINLPANPTPRPAVVITSPALVFPTATAPRVAAAATQTRTPAPLPTQAATEPPTVEPSEAPTNAAAVEATEEVVASPTARAVAAADALAAEMGALCVTVFEDANENRQRDAAETVLPGAEIVVTGGGEAERVIPVAADDDPRCEDLPPGEYEVSARLPEGYGATTSDRVMVTLVQGGSVAWEVGGLDGFTPPAAPDTDADAVDDASETVETGAVAPMADLTVEQEEQARSALDRLWDNSGLIALGLAGVVVAGGGLLLALLRRVTG